MDNLNTSIVHPTQSERINHHPVGSESLLSTTPEDKRTKQEERFRIRLAAEGYDSTMSKDYKDNLSSDTEDDYGSSKDKKRKNVKSGCKCDQIASPLLIVLAVCLLVIVGFVLLAILLKIQLDKSSQMCHSPSCIMTSGVVLSKMDVSVDPCQDFYAYSCTAYTKDVMIPPDRVIFSTFNIIGQKNDARIRRLLSSDGNEYKGRNSSAVQKAKEFFAACMNLTTPDVQGNTNMLQLINNLGSWSLTLDSESGTWSENTWNFESTLALAHSSGMAPFFDLEVETDDKNSSVNIIKIDQSGLTFGDYQSYVGNDSDLFHQAYIEFFTEIVQQLGGDKSKAQQLVENVWQLEKALARAFIRPQERVDVLKLYNMLSLSDVQDLFGNAFNFSYYLGLMFNRPIPPSETIDVLVPIYFHRLGVILEKSRKETLANYIVWSVVQKFVPYMSSAYETILLQLKSRVYKVSSPSPRWQSCVSRTSNAMGFVTGALYVNEYFSEEDKENIEMIYKKIIDTFRMRLPSADWMDSETRSRALEKVNGLMHKIGYPDWILDSVQLDNYYKNLMVTDVAFTNFLSHQIFEVAQVVNRLGTIPDRMQWLMTPDDVNAYYDPSRNQIVMPAGILQPPFIDRNFPKSLSFGAIGFIIGHELTHGFDNSGRHYDKYGNMMDWWGNSSAIAFNQRSQCLVEEYDSFQVYNEHIDGLSTLGENIADNGGMKISLQAYKEWLTNHSGQDELLPGLNMTSLQQFFLSFAQVWCTYYSQQYAIEAIVTDPHSNAKYRVNGVLQNIPEFSQAFSCPSDSPMNPKKKCSLW